MFRVTYDIVTPESAEDGDISEAGFIHAGGWRSADCEPVSLREAVNLVSGSLEDCGSWFTECDGDIDYLTGAEERRSLHPPRNITPASYARLKRVLGVR